MEHNMCDCCDGDAQACQANKATDTCACTVCPCTPAAGEVAEGSASVAEPVVE